MWDFGKWWRHRPPAADARLRLVGILEELGPARVERALPHGGHARPDGFLAVALGTPDQPLRLATSADVAAFRRRFTETTRHAAWLADWIAQLWRHRESAVRAMVTEWLATGSATTPAKERVP